MCLMAISCLCGVVSICFVPFALCDVGNSKIWERATVAYRACAHMRSPSNVKENEAFLCLSSAQENNVNVINGRLRLVC